MAAQHLVIFCGAGFSAPAGLPVMSNFSDRLRASGFLKERQSDFDAIQLKCDSLGAFIGGSARNLEELASFLTMLKLTRPDFEFQDCKTARSPAQALSLVMDGVRHLLAPKLDMSQIKKTTAPFFTFLEREDISLSFITTNYDLVIEFSAIRHAHQAVLRTDSSVRFLYEPGETESIYGKPGASRKIKLFKLHGSINWYRDGDRGATCIHNRFLVEGGRPDRDGPCATNIPQREESSDCLLVPPSVLKPELTPILAAQWQGACDAIATADVLWFIGYSFPESDSFMRYFLTSALFTNAKIRQLVVIDPSREVCGRAKALFRMPSLAAVVTCYPFEWQRLKYENLFEGLLSAAIDREAALAKETRDEHQRRIWGGNL